FPSLSLSFGYGTGYSSLGRRAVLGPNGEPLLDENQNFVTEKTPFMDQFDQNRGGFLRFGFSIPIFDRLQTRSNVERARLQQRNAELDLQNLEQDVALEVRQAYLDYQTAVKRLDATEKQLQAPQQALAAEEERYNVGAATLVELTQARANYVQAAANRAQAIYRFVFQSRFIEYQLGTLDPSQPLLQ